MSTHILLFSKLKDFIQKNLTVFAVLLFFSVLGYGYFITHWAVDSDSVMATFRSYSYDWISHARPIDALYNYLSLEQVLPFFNDFISVFFIFLSGILWLIIIENCGVKLSKTQSVIFGCICIVCPMYAFFLRFTLQNMFTEFSLVMSVLSAYHFSSFLNNKNRFSLIFSILFCSLALMSYQAYTSYFITAVVFIILLRGIANNTKQRMIVELVYGAFALIIAMVIYKLVCVIAFHISPQSDYTEQFIGWGNKPIMSILSGWKIYFTSLLSMNFNFFMLLTVSVALPCLVAVNLFKKRILVLVILLVFVASPFALVFGLGNDIPLRTLQAVPLMLAGMWFLLYHSCVSKVLKQAILIIVIASTFYNAQHINRLFYSDVMRAEYDKNFANRIYNHMLDKTGDAVESKPLVIIGTHYYKYKPFIEHYDSIGPSFFDTNAEQSVRLYNFMTWLGNDYIMPNQAEVNDAYVISDHMPSYPNNGYVKETKDLIVLKLSDRVIVNPPAIELDLTNYTLLPPSDVRSDVEAIKQDYGLNMSGWAYIKNEDAASTKAYIKISDSDTSKIYPVNVNQRSDIAKWKNDAANIQDSGWSIFFTENPLKRDSKIDLILVNGSTYAELDISKKIRPIDLNLKKYKELPYTEQRSFVDMLSYCNGFLTISGWAYMKHKDALNTQIYVNLHNSEHSYIYKTSKTIKTNVQKLYSDTLNVKNSGFSISNAYDLPKGSYKVSLILVNGDDYIVTYTGQTINEV